MSLISSDTSEITVPATVRIPAGQTSVTFSVIVWMDTLVDGTKSVIITASASGWTSADKQVDIRDNEPRGDCPDCTGDNPVVKNVTIKAGMDCECEGKNSLTIGPGVRVEKDGKITFKGPNVKVISGVHAEEGSTVRIIQK